MDIVFSNIGFVLNDKFIKFIPKIGDLSDKIHRGDICKLYIDTTCHSCVKPKDTSIFLLSAEIHEVNVMKVSNIKNNFDSDDAEDFLIDLKHQNQNISDDDYISIITLFEH